VFDKYLVFGKEALQAFYDRHWQCEYNDKTVPRNGEPYGRCVNVRSAHVAKGHQNQDGKLRVGPHVASNTLKELQDDFSDRVFNRFQELFRDLNSNEDPWKFHEDILTDFYSEAGHETAYKYPSTCFSCLCKVPEHALPCGHIICVLCISSAGTALGNGFIELSHCPLMRCQGDAWRDKSSWLISTKPPQAGVRIMTLDG